MGKCWMWTVCAVVLSGYTAASAAEEIVSLTTRPGVTQSFILVKADRPWAAAVLLPGGNGDIELSNGGPKKKGNFLVRSRALFAGQGVTVAVADAASDSKGAYGLGDRTGKDHARDIQAIIEYLRQQTHVPVWVIGTSRGTVSAANAAARLGANGPSGVVLTSTVSESVNRRSSDVFDVDLQDIKVPVLLVHHANDACEVSPYASLSRVTKKLSGAPIVKILSYTGGDAPTAGPCEAHSHHGYLGIEQKVVKDIAAWMKNPTRD